MLRWLVCVVPVLVLFAMPVKLPAQVSKVALDQAGGKVAGEPPKEAAPAKPKTRARELHKLLQQPYDKHRAGIDPGTPLKDALDTIARLASTPDLRVDFRIDYASFKDYMNEERDMVDQKKVGVPASPKGQLQPLEKVLRDLLGQIDVSYLIQGDEILVVYDRLEFGTDRGVKALMVHTQLDKRPLVEALEELSDLTGISIVLDSGVGEKAKIPVTAAFKRVPLPAAVRVLANMADLKPVVIDNVLYVTTKEKAQELIDDSAAEPLPLISRSGGAVGA